MHDCHLDVTKADKLVREAAQGNISVIRDFIVKHPDKVRKDGRKNNTRRGKYGICNFLFALRVVLK